MGVAAPLPELSECTVPSIAALQLQNLMGENFQYGTLIQDFDT